MGQKLCGDKWISLWKNEKGVLYVQMDDAALVVPITPEGDILCITEPSQAYGGRVLGLPAGNIEQGETAADAANRELQEEIGLKAMRLTLVGQLHTFIKYVRGRHSVYLA